MKKMHDLKSKWLELDSSAKKKWFLCILILLILLLWQIYSNYQYHKAQELKELRVQNRDHPSQLLEHSGSIVAGSLNPDPLFNKNFLPQTNRNLGLEDLKADFDNTRQVVLEAKDELHQMSEQNKQLQAKLILLEQFRQNYLLTSKIDGSVVQPYSATPVSLKSVLPPPGDFNQIPDNLAQYSNHPGTSLVHTEPVIYDEHIKHSEIVSPNSSLPNETRHLIRQWSTPEVNAKDTLTAKQFVTIPATSVIDAVMLSGINARTSATGGTTGGSIISANNVGSPFISKIKGSAILPNGWRVADLTDCFLSGTGIGILSTERANITADRLTCINRVGLIFEAKIKAYGVDLDGIQGLSGRLVTKQGSILAKEAAAGMFAGVGSAFSPQALPSYNSSASSGSQQGYVMPNTSLIAGSAIGQGVSTSLGQLSKFYLDYARQMFPIVEVNAGTRISWVVQESFDLVPSTQK